MGLTAWLKLRETTRDGLPWQPFYKSTRSQFSEVRIEKYRGISGLVLDNPRRINLLVGVNNAGKTSLLEAIYLLAHQNDERALLNLIQWRGRVDREPDPGWLVEQLPRSINLSGRFDDVDDNLVRVDTDVSDQPDSSVDNQTFFLSRLSVKSSYAGHQQSTEVSFFSRGMDLRQTRRQGQHWLCRSAFTSP